MKDMVLLIVLAIDPEGNYTAQAVRPANMAACQILAVEARRALAKAPGPGYSYHVACVKPQSSADGSAKKGVGV